VSATPRLRFLAGSWDDGIIHFRTSSMSALWGDLVFKIVPDCSSSFTHNFPLLPHPQIVHSMPLKIKTLHGIYQHGYGRMDASTPGKGIGTSGVASANVIVFHSPTTGRTTVTQTPNFLHFPDAFLPMIDWVTGGPPERTTFTIADKMNFATGKEAKECALEVAILRGWAYGTPAYAAQCGHVVWMRDFRLFLDTFTRFRKLIIHIFDSPKLLKQGVVLVDKITGTITHVELAPGVKELPLKLELSSTLTGEYSPEQSSRVLFLSALLILRRTSEPMSPGLAFNVDQHCLPAPLSDEARQLIRSQQLGQPPSKRGAIIRSFNQSEDWTKLRKNQTDELSTAQTAFSVAARHRPCERCSKRGEETCSACQGAWYCGAAHQREDWKEHKAWCKKHPASDA